MTYKQIREEFKDEFTTSLSMLNLVVWLKSISYVRTIKTTRVFIFLFMRVVIALKSFFIFFFFFMMTFGTCFLTINMKTEENSWWDRYVYAIGVQWLQTFGEFELAHYREESYTGGGFFFFSTWMLTLILLNIVIAQIADVYEKVMTNIYETDNKELNSMIIQYENKLFWKRWNNAQDYYPQKYLYWITYTSAKQSEWKSQVDYVKESLNTPIKNLKSKMVILNKMIGKSEKKLAMVSSHILSKFDESRKRGDKIRKEMHHKIEQTNQINKQIEDRMLQFEQKMIKRFKEAQRKSDEDVKELIQTVFQRLEGDSLIKKASKKSDLEREASSLQE